MKATDASSLVPGGFARLDTASSCAQVALPAAPGRVLAMLISGRVMRLDVLDSVVRTDVGAGVGDSEEKVLSLYEGRTTVGPHKYGTGKYIVVTPAASTDLMYRTIFETDGQRVTRYRVGIVPFVGWVEGCG